MSDFLTSRTLFPRPLQKKLWTEMYSRAELDPTTRPFQLTLPEIGRLCHAYNHIILRQPSLASYNARGPKKQPIDEYLIEDEKCHEEDIADSNFESNSNFEKT